MTTTDARDYSGYGLDQLDRTIRKDPSGSKLKCVVKGCYHWLRPPTRKGCRGDVCPEHGIRVHSSGTFSYADERRNLLDPEYFSVHIRHHPFKLETHRFGQENSEDALSFNVFRELQRAACLKEVVKLCTGISIQSEPNLLLWGLHIGENGVEPWDLLTKARDRFESDLPVERPKTEPDIALFVPGQLILLIEAKFCSRNTFYVRDRKTKLFDLTFDQLLNLYQDPSLRILDYAEAHRRDRIFHQLWRNMTFAEWMAAKDGAGTEAFHANLVREGCEQEVCSEFLSVMRSEHCHHFEQVSWEQIYQIAARCGLTRLCRYLEGKTTRLKPAFRIAATNRRS